MGAELRFNDAEASAMSAEITWHGKFQNHWLGRQRSLKVKLAEGKQWSLAETLFRPAWRFVRAYGLRRGFLDGFPGLWIAWSTAYQTFVRHSRLYEHRHQGQPPDEPRGGGA